MLKVRSGDFDYTANHNNDALPRGGVTRWIPVGNGVTLLNVEQGIMVVSPHLGRANAKR